MIRLTLLLLATFSLGCQKLVILGPAPRGQPTQYPIVLAHGFLSSPDFLSFYEVQNALEADGHRVFETKVPKADLVEIRGAYLARQLQEILARTGDDYVNIIAHSMGGLDARYVINHTEVGKRVVSLTTVGTPHRGTFFAELALYHIRQWEPAVSDLVLKLTGYERLVKRERQELAGALRELTPKGTMHFNQQVPNAPNVFYQSWAGVAEAPALANLESPGAACENKWLSGQNRLRRDVMDQPLAELADFLVSQASVPAYDGLVTVKSAKWGLFRGCLPADHLNLIGQPHLNHPNPETGFSHIRFYRNMAYDLAERGF